MTYYKFLPIERISYLEDELLRFTQPNDLNDPFECFPQEINETKLYASITKLLISNNSRIKKNEIDEIFNKIKNNVLENFIEKAYEKTNQQTGILSLTKEWNNTLMWSHYTNSHKGFCVGFNSGDHFFTDINMRDKEYAKHTKEVVYSDKRAEINVDIPYAPPSLDIYFTKSIDWKYENEVRSIQTFNMADKIIESSVGINNIYLFKVPHKIITEIVVGAKIDIESSQLIYQFCCNHKIDLYKSKISNLKFDMEREILLQFE